MNGSATLIKFSISMFLHFCTQQVFLRYLGKFQSITNIRTPVGHIFEAEVGTRPPSAVLEISNSLLVNECR